MENAIYMSMDIPDAFFTLCYMLFTCSHQCLLDLASLLAFKIVKLFAVDHYKSLHFCDVLWSMGMYIVCTHLL